MDSKNKLSLLGEKINPLHVKTRKQNYQDLSYIEGWVAENNANRIFDYKWSKELKTMEKLYDREYQKENKKMVEVAYTATVRVTIILDDEIIFRDGTGFGNGQSSILSGAYELAIKEAETDAMKRALKSLGNQFGIELYSKEYEPKESYDVDVLMSSELNEALDRLSDCKSVEEVSVMYKDYKGSYRKEFDSAVFNKKSALKC